MNQAPEMDKFSVFTLKNLHEIVILLLANCVANFLFIKWYSYYSDDWSAIVTSPDANISYLTILSDAQRPLLYAVDKFVSSLHLDLFHIQVAGLILSSLFLIFLYLIIGKIARDCGYSSYLPFICCLLYVVLFNKDEVYPWLIVSTCNMAGYLCYAISIFCYLHREKRFFLLISLITYLLGLLTYEIGLALPLFFMVYELFSKQKLRFPLYYLVPLGLVLIIRSTEWFGFGHIRLSRDVAGLDPSLLLLHTGLFIITSLLILSNQIQFSSMGWTHMSPVLMGSVLLTDILLILMVTWSLRMYRFTERGSVRYLVILLTGLFTFSVPYILTTGGTPTRGYIFVDLFVAGLIGYGIVRTGGEKYGRIVVLLMFFFSILVCQGLYMNWVISGEITEEIAAYVCSHSEEIGSFSHIYFNSTSFTSYSPNTLSTAYQPTREDLFRLKKQFLGNWFNGLIARMGKEDEISRIDEGYVQYYNAKCLDSWALSAMLERCGLSNKTLIYGGNWGGNFPTGYDGHILRYQHYENYLPAGPEVSVPRSQVFEITYPEVTGS